MINDQVYLYDYKTYANIFPDVENGIIGFINGYVSCPATNNTHLWLGVGLNNQSTKDKNNINFEHGQKWGQMVAALNTLINNAGLQNKIGIAGAMDIEPSWSSFNVTQDWLNGFVQGSNYSLFFDFGTCTDAGCQQNNVPDKYGWTTDNIYTVSSGGIRNRYPLPEIYNTMWAQALYWQNLNKYEMSQNHSPIRFAGVMTQQMACIEKDTGIIKGKNGEPDACDPTIKNSPAEGWQQLQQVLFSDPQTKDYASNWYLTDISYRR
jgi:hypothetical protein